MVTIEQRIAQYNSLLQTVAELPVSKFFGNMADLERLLSLIREGPLERGQFLNIVDQEQLDAVEKRMERFL
jgi:hypothetical protein